MKEELPVGVCRETCTLSDVADDRQVMELDMGTPWTSRFCTRATIAVQSAAVNDIAPPVRVSVTAMGQELELDWELVLRMNC